MDDCFSKLLDMHTPRANTDITEGLAYLYFPRYSEEYIDNILRGLSKSLPPGMEYKGYTRITPEEEYMEATRERNYKRIYDLARSDLYMIKLRFEYKGQPLAPRYMYMPFVDRGGLIHLGGTLYHISPVLTDKVISPSSNNVFIRLLRDKVIFDRFTYSFLWNGNRDVTQVIWSGIYRKTKEIKKLPVTTKARSCIAHYLFARYGMLSAFEKYCGFKPVVGEDEINSHNYPASNWIICESSQVKPRTYIQSTYNPTRIKLAIPINHWTPLVKSLVGGFYYVADNFPSYLKPDYLNNRNTWMILLGHIIFSGTLGIGKLYDSVNEHFESLDNYIDPIISHKLAELGYDVKDFYDLLIIIIMNFDSWVSNADGNVSMYGKTLEILYDVMYNISESIFTMNFRLNKAATKKAAIGKELTAREIEEILNRRLKTGSIFKLTGRNIAVSTVSYSGDNMYPKITSNLSQQQSMSGGGRKKKGRKGKVAMDASKRVHVSMADAGNILFLSKANPSPADKANMFMSVDLTTGSIIPKAKFADLLQETDKILKGKIPNSRGD